tara:strand:- start:152 stop:631 length:480 start_codon:yes stop_codon:yes gene_type:complete
MNNIQRVIDYVVYDEINSYKANPKSDHILHNIALICIEKNMRSDAANIFWQISKMDEYENTDNLLWKNHKTDIPRDYIRWTQTTKALESYLNPEDEDIYVCNYCGGNDVTTASYTNPNDLNETELSEHDDYDSCGNCYEEIEIITKKQFKERIANGSAY